MVLCNCLICVCFREVIKYVAHLIVLPSTFMNEPFKLLSQTENDLLYLSAAGLFLCTILFQSKELKFPDLMNSFSQGNWNKEVRQKMFDIKCLNSLCRINISLRQLEKN